jgi:hypothetical protein
MFICQTASVSNELSLFESRLLRRSMLIQQMLSNEELLIIMWWQINFDTDQKEAVVDRFASSDNYRLLKLINWPVFYTPCFKLFNHTAYVSKCFFSFFPWPDSPKWA